MKVDVRTVSDTLKAFDVRLDWEEIADRYDKIFNNMRKRLRVDGFRPGKVPVELARKMLREDIKFELGRELVPDIMERVLKENGIKEYVEMDIKNLDLVDGESFGFSVEVEVDPEIHLIGYKKGFAIEKSEFLVTDEDVDEYIEELRERYAESREIESGARDGDYITCDIQELGEGDVPLLGRKIENRMIRVGEGIFGSEGASGLIGAKKGDKVVVRLTNEKGEEKSYEISVKRVEERVFPEFDDEFVKKSFEGVETTEELREKVREYLQAEWNRRSEEEFEASIVNYFVANTDVAVPESRIKRYLDGLIENIKARSREKIDEEKIKEEYRPIAIRDIKWFLIEKAIARKEGIRVDSLEVEDEIKRIAERYPEDQRADVIKYYRQKEARSRLEVDLFERKILEHIKNYVKVKKKKYKVSDIKKRRVE